MLIPYSQSFWESQGLLMLRDRYTHTHLFYYLSGGFRMAYFQMPIIYSEKDQSQTIPWFNFPGKQFIWEMQYFLHLGFLTLVLITKVAPGNCVVVQWLVLSALTAGARIQSLIRELRSCKLSGMAKKKKYLLNDSHLLTIVLIFKTVCIFIINLGWAQIFKNQQEFRLSHTAIFKDRWGTKSPVVYFLNTLPEDIAKISEKVLFLNQSLTEWWESIPWVNSENSKFMAQICKEFFFNLRFLTDLLTFLFLKVNQLNNFENPYV